MPGSVKATLVCLFIAFFNLGVMVGIIFGISTPAYTATNSYNIPLPEDVWIATIDGETFTCLSRPILRGEKIKLMNCQETFGQVTLIREYQTITIVERE